MFENKVIALNVDGNLLAKLAELLGGEVAEQVKGALAAQGIAIPEAPKAEPVVEKPEHTFGELISFEEDEFGWTGEYYVKGATEINIYPDDEADVQIELLNQYGENNGDVFTGGDDFDLNEIGAAVDGDILYVTIPKYADYEPFRNVEVSGFDAGAAAMAGEDSLDDSLDNDPCDCEGCKYDRV
jgi:hypothetical protein